MSESTVSVGKGDLVDLIASDSGVSKAVASRILDLLAAELSKTLTRGGTFRLPGVGAFTRKDRPARMGRNPRTGEMIPLPAKSVPVFSTAKPLRDALNAKSTG